MKLAYRDTAASHQWIHHWFWNGGLVYWC